MIYRSVAEYIRASTNSRGRMKSKFVDNIGQYVNICCGFDIETTTVNGHSYMYLWQFSIEGDVIMDRTWESFAEFYELIIRQYRIKDHPKNKLLVWIHNASYEWQYIKHRLTWSKVFALEQRKLCYFITEDGVEFRDSYVLTNMSLDKLARTYTDVKKLTGALDYSIKRNSKTRLTPIEEEYAALDVVILAKFGRYIFNTYGSSIPLTKTGIVRGRVKERFKALASSVQKNLHKIIDRAMPTLEEYIDWMRYLYCGGWTHADYVHTGEIIEDPENGEPIDMASLDFKSSYPSSMFDMFPWKFQRILPERKYFDKWYVQRDKKAIILDATFTNLRIRGSHSVISFHKIKDWYGARPLLDNGRVVFSKKCRLVLNEWDFEILSRFYTFDDDFEIHKLYISTKKRLPQYLLDTVYEYYHKKETLPKDTLDYTLSKANLNSLYGMCCTMIIQEDLTWNGSEIVPSGNDIPFWRASKGKLLLPQWGIWISSISRYNLLSTIDEITKDGGEDDVIYGDTDSMKLLHYHRHKAVVDAYNEKIIARNQYIKEELGYDLGVLGTFDNETPDGIERFKTLGCKRYLTQYHGEVKATIAGLPKKALNHYCEKNNLDIWTTFDNMLSLSPAESEKRTAIYNDEPHEDVVVDPDGIAEIMREYSSTTITDIPFSMNMTSDYLSYILTIKERAGYAFGIRGL